MSAGKRGGVNDADLRLPSANYRVPTSPFEFSIEPRLYANGFCHKEKCQNGRRYG
jgi:hypothetical protein